RVTDSKDEAFADDSASSTVSVNNPPRASRQLGRQPRWVNVTGRGCRPGFAVAPATGPAGGTAADSMSRLMLTPEISEATGPRAVSLNKTTLTPVRSLHREPLPGRDRRTRSHRPNPPGGGTVRRR